MTPYFALLAIILLFLYFLAKNYELSKPKRNSNIANSACQIKDRRYMLRRDFKILFFCNDEKRHRIFIIRSNVVMIKKGDYYIIPVKDCKKVPNEIKKKYATEHQKRLVINFPLNYVLETNECYGKPAEFEVEDV